MKVDGDSRQERVLRLTSIRTVSAKKQTSKHANTPKKKEDTVTMSKKEYQRLVSDIDSLSAGLAELRIRLKIYESNN